MLRERIGLFAPGNQTRIPALAPVQNQGQHGFGRAVIHGQDHMKGDATVIMMADESAQISTDF